MRTCDRTLGTLRRVVGLSALMLLCAGPGFSQAAPKGGSGYVATMKDWLGVNDAMQRYRWGLEKHDRKAFQSAFWEDGADIAIPSPGQEIRMPLDGSPPTGGPIPMGPPPGAAGPGQAPPGGPPGAGPPPGGVEVWHMPFADYFHFESPTRATHYEYFLSIYPQPEKTGVTLPAMETRQSIVGWPGHYEDILEKRHGEWRILQRKSYINAK